MFRLPVEFFKVVKVYFPETYRRLKRDCRALTAGDLVHVECPENDHKNEKAEGGKPSPNDVGQP